MRLRARSCTLMVLPFASKTGMTVTLITAVVPKIASNTITDSGTTIHVQKTPITPPLAEIGGHLQSAHLTHKQSAMKKRESKKKRKPVNAKKRKPVNAKKRKNVNAKKRKPVNAQSFAPKYSTLMKTSELTHLFGITMQLELFMHSLC